jgi:hypothetical protein
MSDISIHPQFEAGKTPAAALPHCKEKEEEEEKKKQKQTNQTSFSLHETGVEDRENIQTISTAKSICNLSKSTFFR